MAVLDTAYGASPSQAWLQGAYTRSSVNYYRDYREYEHSTAQLRLNLLHGHASPPGPAPAPAPAPGPAHHYDLHARLLVKEERLGGGGGGLGSPDSYHAAFKPYSSGDQENVPQHANIQPKGFGSKADLQLHTQVHMREPKPYKCSHCSKSFANSSYLSQHMRIHLGIKPYRCEICQRKFTQLSHLQQHIRTHTGDKPYKCRHAGCTKAFSQLSNLQSHSRCHQTDKPYKCNSCYKCFHDEAALLEHIPKHKESKHLKTHICSYCGKSYTQETYLAKHMQKHADRSDKRPPIVASGTSAPPGVGMGPASVLANIGSPATEHYWQHKMAADPGYGGYPGPHQLMDQRLAGDPRDYDPRGLHPGAGQHASLMEAGAGQWGGEHAGAGLSPNSGAKTSSSAFSPLQSSMLQSSPGFPGMAAAPRSYPAFYDPISFPQPPTKVNFGEPSTNSSSAGPQLLSLTKIKNYAHNPHNDGIFKSLTSLSQDKTLNHLGQLGAAQ